MENCVWEPKFKKKSWWMQQIIKCGLSDIFLQPYEP